ncbi:ABC transporter permease subunit [Blastococcus sp. PRF04-17]|uniref:ABC transporter permease subunit n=1 Tax=Blastococcus sp. PRF04-17 TaxID=2933797 RepID=UPI002112C91B|nr:hypothetical protein [Blastococcus sp. PRF04-17]
MSNAIRRGATLALLAVAILLPFVLDGFWLQTGLFAMAAIVGAIGLTLLVGVAGQLSLGHAFFAAVGAFTYAWLAGEADAPVPGLGLPPLLAFVLAASAAALAGALFSPIAGRLRGIYLGLATLGLVFLARHLIVNLDGISGGSTGAGSSPSPSLASASATAIQTSLPSRVSSSPVCTASGTCSWALRSCPRGSPST